MENPRDISEHLEIIDITNNKCSRCNNQIGKNTINKKYFINDKGMFEPICDNCFWDAMD